MTIQEKLRDRIYELLPEKKELSFGCEVVFKGNGNDGNNNCSYHPWTLTGIERSSRGIVYKYIFAVGNFGYSNSYINIKVEKSDYDLMFKNKKIKIIGQPIHLADLLLAIDIDNIELVYKYEADKDYIKTKFLNIGGYLYNLSKDDIMLQSDEFCEFAYELIK